MANKFVCPIWGTDAEQLTKSFDGLNVRSPRTGGDYRISGSVLATIGNMSAAQKALLTTWIVEQRRFGEAAPLVTDYALEDAVARRPLRFSEKKQRFMMLALAREFRPSSFFKIAGQVDRRYHDDTGAIAAWTECQTDADRQGLIALWIQEGIVKGDTSGTLKLTSAGFELMETVEQGGASTKRAFVAMWFDQSMDEAYRAIAHAIEDTGFDSIRIDRKEHGNKIDDEIIAEIRNSRFLVADFTCGLVERGGVRYAVSRGGVYYEAGFAQGLRTPVIWTCRADCIDHVHFDTRQYNHIVWKEPTELETRLTNRIRATIV